jgi:hypothetical protein
VKSSPTPPARHAAGFTSHLKPDKIRAARHAAGGEAIRWPPLSTGAARSAVNGALGSGLQDSAGRWGWRDPRTCWRASARQARCWSGSPRRSSPSRGRSRAGSQVLDRIVDGRRPVGRSGKPCSSSSPSAGRTGRRSSATTAAGHLGALGRLLNVRNLLTARARSGSPGRRAHRSTPRWCSSRDRRIVTDRGSPLDTTSVDQADTAGRGQHRGGGR